jgi:putative ABC transport system permease protein
VAALVVLTTMTRLAEKERPLIGCYRTLGMGGGRILFKYLLFAAVCCVAGSFAGLVVGSFLVMPVIYNGYAGLFARPVLAGHIYWAFGLVASAVMLASVLLVTLYILRSLLREKPAELLRFKSPKAGRTVLLERIPLIWNRLSFKYKSTVRNIFRQIRHFMLSIVSVAGSTALVFAGFGLNDAASANSLTSDLAGKALESMVLISVVLILFAALLNILVIYNLTNINIEERRREIATLKVLGYKNIEVTGYIFREVLITSVIGILAGLPLGLLFIHTVFGYVEFGAVGDINWYSWVLTAALSLAFTAIVDLLLFRKITKTDMNASLKAID